LCGICRPTRKSIPLKVAGFELTLTLRGWFWVTPDNGFGVNQPMAAWTVFAKMMPSSSRQQLPRRAADLLKCRSVLPAVAARWQASGPMAMAFGCFFRVWSE
jgi:hypothetical protein